MAAKIGGDKPAPVFNLDTADVGNRREFSFTFRGDRFVLPSMNELAGFNFYQQLGEGPDGAVNVLLEALGEQADVFKKASPNKGQIDALFTRYAEFSGVESGN